MQTITIATNMHNSISTAFRNRRREKKYIPQPLHMYGSIHTELDNNNKMTIKCYVSIHIYPNFKCV